MEAGFDDVCCCPVGGGEEGNETAEARTDKGQPPISAIEHIVQGRQCLANCEGRRQFGEGPIAIAMAETIESKRGDASPSQAGGQCLIVALFL